jgi:hypothetical protein
MRYLVLLLASLFAIPCFAQQTQGPALPVRVPNVNLIDLNKNPMNLPDLGKKHLMIFYIDPDAHRQNREFQADVEAREPELYSPYIQAYAILNLKDTILPGALVRAIAERRTKGKPSVNLADNGRIVSDAWGLGDCNGMFCVLFVTKDCDLVYFRAGDFTQRDIDEFYATVKKYQ